MRIETVESILKNVLLDNSKHLHVECSLSTDEDVTVVMLHSHVYSRVKLDNYKIAEGSIAAANELEAKIKECAAALQVVVADLAVEVNNVVNGCRPNGK